MLAQPLSQERKKKKEKKKKPVTRGKGLVPKLPTMLEVGHRKGGGGGIWLLSILLISIFSLKSNFFFSSSLKLGKHSVVPPLGSEYIFQIQLKSELAGLFLELTLNNSFIFSFFSPFIFSLFLLPPKSFFLNFLKKKTPRKYSYVVVRKQFWFYLKRRLDSF